jgi:hypothetical protein
VVHFLLVAALPLCAFCAFLRPKVQCGWRTRRIGKLAAGRMRDFHALFSFLVCPFHRKPNPKSEGQLRPKLRLIKVN